MIPVIRWTIWQRRWSIMWWCIGVFFFIVINMVFYPSFKDQAAELQKSFENLSQSALQFIGGSSDFFSPVGFLNSQIYFLMLPLLLGVLAIGTGSSILGREEQDMTIENLLSRPVSRSKLLLAKARAAAIIVLLVSLLSLLTTVVIAKIVKLEVPATDMAAASFACFLLVLSFGAISFLLSAIGKARSAGIGIATFIALGGYIIDSLAGTVDWLKVPAKVFPFHYYDPEAILRHSYDWGNLLFFVGVIAVCGLISWLSFRRRDLG